MARQRWKTDFSREYARMWKPDRDYGERAYDDKFHEEKPPSMPKDAEPDYETHIKPYKPEKPAEPWEAAPEGKIDPQKVNELIEPKTSNAVEDLELQIKRSDFLEHLEKQPFDAEPKKKTDAEPIY